jgi:RimJ/RimL family protein N-acetyltransferase
MKFRDYHKEDQFEVKNIFVQYWNDNDFLNELDRELNRGISKFYVVKKDHEIIGVAGVREIPRYLKRYATTQRPVELYIIASKYQNNGIGKFLGEKIIEETKNLRFTEILCYSPETHSNSWKFYEKLGFTKEGIINDPDDGYPGMLWKKIL